MPIPRLILVGGFLGAGKTTLLSQVAVRLQQRGSRVAVVANDQAPDLVDTNLLRQQGIETGEVAGACFCCSFNDLADVLTRLNREHRPDVLLAEPVGSCTDLAATVIRPLKHLYKDRFDIAPFSVLADPLRLREALAPRQERTLPDNVTYIYRLQLQEADIIVLNKSDLISASELVELQSLVAQRYPGRSVFSLSALTGEGVDGWLDAVLDGKPAGAQTVEVDYDAYAEGEAALAWLNASIQLQADTPQTWADFLRDLMEALRRTLQTQSARIAHAKAILTASTGYVAANLTDEAALLTFRGSLSAPANQATLVLNLRVLTSPEILRQTVETSLHALSGENLRPSIVHLQSFRPGRPNPTHRCVSSRGGVV